MTTEMTNEEHDAMIEEENRQRKALKAAEEIALSKSSDSEEIICERAEFLEKVGIMDRAFFKADQMVEDELCKQRAKDEARAQDEDAEHEAMFAASIAIEEEEEYAKRLAEYYATDPCDECVKDCQQRGNPDGLLCHQISSFPEVTDVFTMFLKRIEELEKFISVLQTERTFEEYTR